MTPITPSHRPSSFVSTFESAASPVSRMFGVLYQKTEWVNNLDIGNYFSGVKSTFEQLSGLSDGGITDMTTASAFIISMDNPVYTAAIKDLPELGVTFPGLEEFDRGDFVLVRSRIIPVDRPQSVFTRPTHPEALELNLLETMEEDQGSLKDFGNDLPGLVDAVENARLDSVNYFAVLQLPRRQRQQELEKQSQQLQQEVQCINQHIQIF
ncbi:hypothetical protein EDD21DRAFT_358061 [Dissophora ornata]|nr:hypothetical protein EDD21DRAFT_358061 [Dissophora ornata]